MLGWVVLLKLLGRVFFFLREGCLIFFWVWKGSIDFRFYFKLERREKEIIKEIIEENFLELKKDKNFRLKDFKYLA